MAETPAGIKDLLAKKKYAEAAKAIEKLTVNAALDELHKVENSQLFQLTLHLSVNGPAKGKVEFVNYVASQLELPPSRFINISRDDYGAETQG
jgi:hypothetical protein